MLIILIDLRSFNILEELGKVGVQNKHIHKILFLDSFFNYVLNFLNMNTKFFKDLLTQREIDSRVASNQDYK